MFNWKELAFVITQDEGFRAVFFGEKLNEI